MDIFIKIIDGATENCPFFKVVRQFNNMILKDVKSYTHNLKNYPLSLTIIIIYW